MDAVAGSEKEQTLMSKKRIPKACKFCRHSKTKCDEQRPTCGRCQTLKKTCVYFERPKTAEEQRIGELEQQVASLQQQLSVQVQIQSSPIRGSAATSRPHPLEVTSPRSAASVAHSSPSITSDQPTKRKRSHFHMQKEAPIPDFVSEGMLSESQAIHYFGCFFDGCDRFVPIFDHSDDFFAVKSRSSLLLNAICAVGCGVSGDRLVDSRLLHVRLTRWMTTVVLSPFTQSLETVQALIVMACWWPERSLLLAIATRMAIELHLDDAFDNLIHISLTSANTQECMLLMKSARTWALVWNLEQILQVDGGNLMSLKAKGVRRCRSLLDKPFSAKLDARLFSQVELNSLRSKINRHLTDACDDLSQAVEDARIDIDIWFNDWKRFIETSPFSGTELPLLMTNLTVQRYWAVAMAACRAVHVTGVNNIDMMSIEQREILSVAKEALQNHLDVMTSQPEYLANFKFAMDFVWAKCAFSFLLLLKLTILLPQSSAQDLVRQGRTLHDELSTSCDYGSRRVYLRLLQLSVEKYACMGNEQSAALDTFVPDEFIFDWDFPGLNLFSSSTGWDILFDQYLLGDDLFAGIYN